MGNSADNRVNLLAKNWLQINSNTYKNTITQELIDSYELQARNEEQLSYNNSLLIKRAAINHYNVLKLIYFYQEQQSNVVCSNKKFKYKIYTEHASGTLASLLGLERSEGGFCHCCSVMSGIGCLVEKYGYFGVSPTMIFMVSSVGLSRIDQKKTAKVWINQDLRVNHAEQICNQQEMCFHLFQLFQLLVQRNLCSKIDVKELSNQRKFKDFFQFIFKTHKKEPSEGKAQRKRVTSQLNGFEANKLHKNVVFTQPNSKTNNLTIKHTNTFPTNNSSRQSLIHAVNNSLNFIEKEPMKHNWFMKKDGYTVKELDLQNRSFHKVEKSKVNFSYTDSLVTPKNNKSFKEVKTAKIVQSPHQQLASVCFRSNKNQGQPEKLQLRRESLPIISFFNSNPKPQPAKIRDSIEQSPQSNPKQLPPNNYIKQNHPAQYLQIDQKKQIKHCEMDKQNNLQIQQTAQSVVRDAVNGSKTKKQNNLKLQKCIDLQCTVPLFESSKKSIESNKQKSTGGFQIAKEYCLSIQPEFKLPSLRIDQSEQLISESVEVSSGLNLRGKGDNFTSNFCREGHLERKESLSSQKISIISNNLVYPHFKGGSSRKGSLPAPQHTLDQKYNNYVHKLEHFSKGITNSINSNGTKKSFPQENYETQMNNQKLLKANNLDIKEYLENHKNVFQNKRSSDLDSCYSQSESLDQRKKVQILQKISNTQKILEQNKKKLQKLQLQKDLQIQKDMIKKEMESLLKNNMMVDESHRIKQKVKHKKATFAELKAEAAKILNDLNL